VSSDGGCAARAADKKGYTVLRRPAGTNWSRWIAAPPAAATVRARVVRSATTAPVKWPSSCAAPAYGVPARLQTQVAALRARRGELLDNTAAFEKKTVPRSEGVAL